ncbi:MAG: Holliday junction helicase RuvA [Actinomycetia bacterium]|nr:Holliday junction helicase RuvA [Actinomycetes bacterium]
MIAFVSGKIASAGVDGAVVDVGGVGLSVQCTPATLATLRVGDPAHLPTSLIVREDSLTLYGFSDEDERTVFELLQTASGIGPRLALAVLATHTPNGLRRAVAAEDLNALMKVSGIGRKGAQRLVLELKDRLGGPIGDGPDLITPTRTAAWRDQVHAGLINLGWTARDADAAVEAVAGDLADQSEGMEAPPIATLLRAALKKLSPS